MKHEFPLEQQRIIAVFWAGDQCYCEVGKGGVALIEVQYIAGDGAMIPWFICWGESPADGTDAPLVYAINSRHVDFVKYEKAIK